MKFDLLYLITMSGLLFKRTTFSFITKFQSKSLIYKFASTTTNFNDNIIDENLYTTFTFYKFAENKLVDPESVVTLAKEKLSILQLKGTLIFAKEGINAQVTMRDKDIPTFKQLLSEVHPFLSNINLNIGERKHIDIRTQPLPFKRMIIRTKSEILTDGIDDDIDWTDAGPELDSPIWHNELSTIKDNNNNNNSISSSNKTIVLDCRNGYESEMGTFEHAQPLNTTKFSESWDVLENILEDIPKDTRILTFCTGGIRCVKVNAYLRQKLGYTNTGRLKDGIVAYERWVDEEGLIDSDASITTIAGSSSNDAVTAATKSATVSTDSADVRVADGSDDASVQPSSSRSGESDRENKSKRRSLFKGKNFVFDRRRMIQPAEE